MMAENSPMEWRSNRYMLPCLSLYMKITEVYEVQFICFRWKAARGTTTTILQILNSGVLLISNRAAYDRVSRISKFEDKKTSNLLTKFSCPRSSTNTVHVHITVCFSAKNGFSNARGTDPNWGEWGTDRLSHGSRTSTAATCSVCDQGIAAFEWFHYLIMMMMVAVYNLAVYNLLWYIWGSCWPHSSVLHEYDAMELPIWGKASFF